MPPPSAGGNGGAGLLPHSLDLVSKGVLPLHAAAIDLKLRTTSVTGWMNNT